jgi:multidrug efflux pump subunit AcrB
VTAEIEEALREISEVDVIESTSATGISLVSIELLETLGEDQIELAWSDIRDALSDTVRAFPAGAFEPELDTDGGGAYGAIVALTPARDDVPMTLVGRYGEALADAPAQRAGHEAGVALRAAGGRNHRHAGSGPRAGSWA